MHISQILRGVRIVLRYESEMRIAHRLSGGMENQRATGRDMEGNEMKPIIFNTAMVRAILDGRKTVTRRVVKARNTEILDKSKWAKGPYWFDVIKTKNGQKVATADIILPPYKQGDILYVRETWCDPSGTGYPIMYMADLPIHYDAEETEHGEPVDLCCEDFTWRPSIHMPRDYARIFLRVTKVRVERLQDITEEEKLKEGAPIGWGQYNFYELWDSTIKEADKPLYGWDANPWVFRIEFERISQEEAYHEIP